MNNKIIAAVVVVVVVSIAYAAYRLGSRTLDNPHAATNSKQVLYWHDPMHPEQHFDKPGKSPFMDMQLVPVYADDAQTDVVVIDPRMQQRLGVRLARVEMKPLTGDVTAAGSVEYNERDVAVVQARANGFIEHVYVRTPLQAVSAGQVLADVYVPDWIAAQEEYLAVERMQSDAHENLLAAAKQRMRLAGMTDEQIAEVAKNKTTQARISLRAPIAGVITELSAREGMTVMNGASLFRINGLSTVWVYGELPEAKIAQIKPGLEVKATASALPGIPLQGKVLAVLPEVSAETRTAKARIELQNNRQQLAPGMFVTVRFATEARAVLVIPSEAIITTGTRSVVIVAEEGGRFHPVNVTSGIESNGETEIREGLEEGQQVVVSAQFLIDSESSLKAAANRMSATP
jgi:Cu(I)/Ag(I) efflux system membrane fusion protein